MSEQDPFHDADTGSEDTGSEANFLWGVGGDSEISLMPTSSTPHLLLIEADTSLQTYLAALLREEGYRLQIAVSLEQAIALISAQNFDLVLVGTLSGTPRKVSRALKPLQERLSPSKLGILTHERISAEQAEKGDFAFLLRKPIETEQLLAEIAICFHRVLTPAQKRQAQVVRQFFGALVPHNGKTALEYCAEDMVYYPPGLPLWPFASAMRGKAAMQRYLETLRSSYQHLRLEAQRSYSWSRGVAVRYTMWWTEPDGSWETQGGTHLFQFTGDHICQIGFPGAIH